MSLGAGSTAAHADWRGWRGGDVQQSLRLWLRYLAIASGKRRRPRAGLQLACETSSCGHGLRARSPSGPSHAGNVATGTKETR